MKQQFLRRIVCVITILLTAFLLPLHLVAQNFTVSTLSGTGTVNPTSLQFGPDGKLYVAQQNGIIKVFTVAKNGANSYAVTATQIINLINQIPNYNDDGTPAPSVTVRQVTGLLVAGTAVNPIIYVSSSDSRIGGPEGDFNLDTNSGVLSMLTWNGTAWVKIDLVRGFPRSEENHSVNGMQLDAATNTLFLAVGGNTNAGAPSINFAYTNEYALSAAILSINLNAINAMPTQGSGNTAYKYDLPTLDDPTRANTGGKDPNDPFGGNDGLNQAKIVVGGPVQIYAPGFRNAYDLVITKTPGKAGRLYTVDNGANQGWGGYPQNEGPGGNATNNYVNGEPGSTGPGVNEPQVNNLDNLHFIGNVGTYVSGSYYGGHPTPVRANPSGAGLYTHNGTTGVWRTGTTGPNPLPADWPPVPTANPAESDFHMPGSSVSKSLMTFTFSTNGLTEYTASNFNNALKGNLISVGYNSNMWRIKLNDNGTAVTNAINPADKLIQDPPLAVNFGAVPLDVTTQGDGDIFPGTIWVSMYENGAIRVFEPSDMGSCTGADNNTDEDNDGYTNADEIDNGTNPCSSSSTPPDADGDHISDLNDPDDDNDGKSDVTDHFPIDPNNGMATNLPVNYPLFNNNPGSGFFGLGFTGLMNNGGNYLNSYNVNNLVAGGAAGVLSIVAVSNKDALGATNTQETAFQFGINTNTATGPYTVNARILGPFFNNQTPAGSQSQGIYIGTGDQSNYLKITLNANGGQGGIQVVYENADAALSNQYPLGQTLSATSTVDLYLSVNPVTGSVQPKFAVNGGTPVAVGTPIAISGELLNTLQGASALAVGIISTSAGGNPFTASWDYINITADAISTVWTTIAPSNTPKWVGFSIPYNNRMYVFSGFDHPSVRTTPKVERYDPAANAWTYMADMPFPVTHAGITTDSHRVYVAGGFLGGLVGDPNSDKLQIYNIQTNTWSEGPKLPTPCGGNALVRVGRKLHSFGGLLQNRSTGNPAHYVLDLNNLAAGWTTAAAAPLPRCHFASAVVAGKIYAFGGQVGHDGPYNDVKVVQVYDPNTDTWTQKNDMPYVRSHSEPGTFVIDGKVYLVGGRSGADANILGTITAYNPETDTWTEDIPLPTGVTLFGPAAEVIGNEIFVSNGGLNDCCAPQTTARKRGIARTPNMKIGFLESSIAISTPANSSASKSALLWVLTGTPAYTLEGMPAWLSATPATGTIDMLAGTEIKFTANTNGLAPGTYNATITAKAAGYPNASLPVQLTVTAGSANKVLYVYGKIPPGEVDMKLADTGPTGMSQFKTAIQEVGFIIEEALDANITLNAATLNQYKVVILGSNNRRFTAAEKTAIATWVNAGGGIVAWSDAAFGWQNGGINSTDGALSDNDLTSQFGMQFLRDNGSGVFSLNQFVSDHYLNKFNKNGGITVKAEGVSPVRTTAPATIIANIPAPYNTLNTLDGPFTVNDAALSIAKPGQGRVVCFFDRNAFWNAGDGSRLSEVDNKQFAQRLVQWASGVNDAAPGNSPLYRINAGGPALTNSIGSFSADQYFSTPSEIYTDAVDIVGTTEDAMWQSERYSATDNGSFSYNFPVNNGTYTVKLHFAEIYHTTANQRKFDVTVENTKVLDNYDIFQKAGAKTPVAETFTVTVTDGTLNITFNGAVAEGGVDRPKVSAIEVIGSVATNQPPVANAGADQNITLPTSTATLTGSGTDPDGTIASYAWTKVSGSGTIASPTTASTGITGLTQGTSIFILKVTDNGGLASAPDTVKIIVAAQSGGGNSDTIRVNAGGPALTNSIGAFAADQYFSTPSEIYTDPVDIVGTTEDAMWQSERYSATDNGSFSYNFPVSNGTYKVVLHFAEIYHTTANQRKFDVTIENTKVLDNYDIFQKAGAKKPVAETFTATVTDGTLNITFNGAVAEGGIDRPKVSAIEVLKSAATNQPPVANAGADQNLNLPNNTATLIGSGTDTDGTIASYAWTKVSGSGTISSPTTASTGITGLTQGTSIFILTVTDNGGLASAPDTVKIIVANQTGPGGDVIRINAGGPQVNTSLGVFMADQYFSTPSLTHRTNSGIANTTDDLIYQDDRYASTGNGTLNYAIPVNNGYYKVVLHFAETYWTEANRRIFDVSIENNKKLDNYDIYNKVSFAKATTETFIVQVNDGMLNILFNGAIAEGGKDRPMINAIEVLPSDGNQPPVANAGPDKVIVLPDNSVSFAGSGTDSDGTIASYAWTKVAGSGTINNPASATITVSGLTEGISEFQLVVTDNRGGVSVPDKVMVVVNKKGSTYVYRVNAGGPTLNTSMGAFAADQNFTPSDTYTITSAIGNTTDDALYQTERYSNTDQGTFNYNFPIANGTYKVILHFSENYWQAVNERVFDVRIENNKVLDNYDIFKKAGALNATTETFTLTVSDGTLNINFSASAADGGKDRPKVSAIEVVSQGPGFTPTPIPDLISWLIGQIKGIAIKVYPNPSTDGKFSLRREAGFAGDLEYTLLSTNGTVLRRGKLPAITPGTTVQLDFSREMTKVGIYQLVLMSNKIKTVIKLMKI